ncbi:nitroreductase family deazaflavin-dependent oxidoreductase [Actinomadura barringtoniae]|uniref:Nitroreductase family deazaflavin-dependent oxidoreductase n=1 Tax=Actinomadura barringtoniae TaxID=1427535 RepID=A0A939PLB5_9ACTN|nr:nitroreductase family deazaflavin-dependent oxidoreductase [Actinomadura barringtoniae]MBO2452163.1 nitroreductase family deazaflavin-dependent oxidoreductase [Actinomadura barringtoniae]
MYEPSVFPAIRDQVALYEKTDGAEGGSLNGHPLIILTTTGARTGKLRKTPLLKLKHQDAYIVVASYGGAPNDPDWYRNLKADPTAQVQDGPAKRTLRAREATAAEKQTLWRIADASWPDFPAYRAAAAPREIPILILEPPQPGASPEA